MRILVLHSDVTPDAPPEEQDTLITAVAIGDALRAMGHFAQLAPFTLSPERIRAAVEACRAELVFNLVESVLGQDGLAASAPSILAQLGIAFTGSGAASMAIAGDKPLAKRILRAAGLPTPDWSEPPNWGAIDEARPYIVKSATEDASIGLDDGAVLSGRSAIAARARACAQRHGGRWFAEAYVEGREYNVALVAEKDAMRTLPIPEMRFEDWPERKPRIVGYDAKWKPGSVEASRTVRAFGLERRSPALAASLADLARRAVALFGLRGYARVDFRVTDDGTPAILEVNPNPCLEPEAGFPAAAAAAGLSYGDVLERVLAAATAS